METGPPTRICRRRSADAARRGQLILVGSLALATTLVVIALLLNTAIYAENLASRGGSDTDLPAELSRTSVTATEGSIRYANRHNNTTRAAVYANVTAGVDGWESLAARQVTADSALLSVDVRSTTNGTRIQQTNATRNFTAGGTQAGAGNWTLVTQTSAVRSVRLVPRRAALYEVTLSGGNITNAGSVLDDAFHVTVENASQRWRLYLVRNDTEVIVFSEYPDGALAGQSEISEYCSTTGAAPVVDVTNESLAGAPCRELEFPAEMAGQLNVSYANANDRNGSPRSGGEYSLVVATGVDGSPYEAVPESPFVTPAVYGARIRTAVRTPTVNLSDAETAVPDDPLR